MKLKPKNKIRKARFVRSIQLFVKRIWHLIQQPIFIALTIFGNLVILTGSSVLYFIEMGTNPHIHSYLDTIWWATATVTTVGYGDVVPITNMGKILGIAMMIVGTALFWSYTALFADAIISKEIIDLEDELKGVQKLLTRIDQAENIDRDRLQFLIEGLEAQLKEFKNKGRDGESSLS